MREAYISATSYIHASSSWAMMFTASSVAACLLLVCVAAIVLMYKILRYVVSRIFAAYVKVFTVFTKRRATATQLQMPPSSPGKAAFVMLSKFQPSSTKPSPRPYSRRPRSARIVLTRSASLPILCESVDKLSRGQAMQRSASTPLIGSHAAELVWNRMNADKSDSEDDVSTTATEATLEPQESATTTQVTPYPQLNRSALLRLQRVAKKITDQPSVDSLRIQRSYRLTPKVNTTYTNLVAAEKPRKRRQASYRPPWK